MKQPKLMKNVPQSYCTMKMDLNDIYNLYIVFIYNIHLVWLKQNICSIVPLPPTVQPSSSSHITKVTGAQEGTRQLPHFKISRWKIYWNQIENRFHISFLMLSCFLKVNFWSIPSISKPWVPELWAAAQFIKVDHNLKKKKLKD